MISVSETEVSALMSEIDTVSDGLVSAVEILHPGHRFGQKKAQHMQELTETSSVWSKKLGLPVEESSLLKVIFRSHDLGRHMEALIGSDTSRTIHRHGYESAQILEGLDSWRELSPEAQYVISQAVIWHAEKSVPEPTSDAVEADTLAYKLCYLLRDLDKEELISDANFVSPQGIEEQLRVHYQNRDWSEVINGGISDEVVSRFATNECLELNDLRESYSAYMLLQLSTIYDIHLPEVLGEVAGNKDRYLQPRLGFIQHHVEPTKYQKIIGALNGFLNNFVSSAGIGPASNL